ncbi:AMP-binding protein [Streptomyces griseoluteus]|uniref:AMP-binding protein n=1 Tax=Streptomyces griseoluteus TaxID=29306 RepID=UPI00370149E7
MGRLVHGDAVDELHGPDLLGRATQSSSPASPASAGATLSDLLVQSLTRHSSSEAFVADDRRLTHAHVRSLVSQYMGALSRRGVGLGVGVTMLSPNMPESWIVQAATYLLGGRFTGLQALASVQDHIVVCEDAEAAVPVVSATLEEHGPQVLDQVQFGDVAGEHRGDSAGGDQVSNGPDHG